MEDIFNVIKPLSINDNISNISIINELMNVNNIQIDWTKYLYIFYKNPILINNIDIRIENILIKTFQYNSINHINRFLYLDKIFNIINELNIYYNQKNNYNNYTLYTLQNLYLKFIISNDNELLNHWFNGIYNINKDYKDDKLLDIWKSNSIKYHKGINILKEYLINYDYIITRNYNIDIFINRYIKWIIDKISNDYYNNIITIYDIINDLHRLTTINNIFLPNKYINIFYNKIITEFTYCWDNYLNKVLVDELYINSIVYNEFNIIYSKIEIIIIEFLNKWLIKFKNNIDNGYNNLEIYYSIEKILPLLDNNRLNNNILKYFEDIYKLDDKILDYILIILHIKILKLEKNIISIKNILNFIVLYNNKDLLWIKYYKYLTIRIKYYSKYNLINNITIEYENKIYNYLINYKYTDNKINNIILNLLDSIKNTDNIHNLKINSNIDINLKLANYIIYDKTNYIINKYKLIDYNSYPDNIKGYLLIGKKYYEKTFEYKILTWDLENSLINFNINNTNIISKILQYIIIIHINNNKNTIEELINNIYDKSSDNYNIVKLLLYNYIRNLEENNIIIYDNSILKINDSLSNIIIDISDYNPDKKKYLNLEVIQNTNFYSDNCKTYLRLLYLVKMFKENSTIKYKLDDILDNLYKFIIKKNYSSSCLIDITTKEILSDLVELEQRDIIEKSSNEPISFIYIV
jgi:hypothetical protein